MKNLQDRLGQQIGGYQLLRLLGHGNFGAVYLAQATPEQKPVALKLLQMPLSSSEEFKSFLNEARTIRLQHPHIVPLLDFGTSREDLPYLVMEYVAGGTLREHHPRGTRLPLAVVCHYVSQLASALQYAHDQRVVHRDVKPENMLLQSDGIVLLSDFGIARIVEQSLTTNLDNAAGTPAYIAPEQSYGKPQPASDQYALAVVAYEWLTGSRPFTGTPMEIIVQHRLDAPPSLRTLRQDVSPEVEWVITRALAKQPEERFASITQFAQALNAAARVNASPMPAAPIPTLSTPTSPASPQWMAMPSQAGAPLMPGRGPLVPPQPTSTLTGRTSNLPLSGREQTAFPLAPPPPAYGTPSSASQSLPKDLMTSPIAVGNESSQPQVRWWSVPLWRRLMLAGLALLIIAGSLLTYFALIVPSAQHQAALQATASASSQQATVKAMATAKIQQTATARVQMATAQVGLTATAQAQIIAKAQAQGKPQLLWTFAT